MNVKESLRPGDYFSRLESKEASSYSSISGIYLGLVYDVEANGKFGMYTLYENEQEINVPTGSIICRILRLHDGISATQLPIIFPLNINQEMPLVGNLVLIMILTSGQVYWLGISDRLPLSQITMDEIENRFGGREKIVSSAKDYSSKKVDIINERNPNTILPEEFKLENKLDTERRSGIPLIHIPQLNKLPGEAGNESRYGSGILNSFGDSNNAITYLYKRDGNRPTFNDTVSVVLGTKYNPDKILKENSILFKYFQEKYPKTDENGGFFSINTDKIRINSRSKDLILGAEKELIMAGGDEVSINANGNLIIVSNKEVNVNCKGSEVIINDNGINVNSKNNIQINCDGNLDLNSNKKITLKGEKIRIDSDDVYISNIFKIKNGMVSFGQKIAGLMKDFFISLFNTHAHISGSPGAPTTPPVVQIQNNQTLSTKNLKTSL